MSCSNCLDKRFQRQIYSRHRIIRFLIIDYDAPHIIKMGESSIASFKTSILEAIDRSYTKSLLEGYDSLMSRALKPRLRQTAASNSFLLIIDINLTTNILDKAELLLSLTILAISPGENDISRWEVKADNKSRQFSPRETGKPKMSSYHAVRAQNFSCEFSDLLLATTKKVC